VVTKHTKLSLGMANILDDKIKETLDKIEIVENLSRKKFLWQFIQGLIDVRKVQFNEIATGLNNDVKPASNERRIQAFFEKVELNYEGLAVLLCLFLPKGKVTLSMDRTDWKFGDFNINILVVVVRCGNVGLPIYFEMLDNKRGNSNTTDRQNIMEKCINLLAFRGIEVVVMDREFIGHSWLKYLKEHKIKFCVRVPKSHYITLKNECTYTIEELLATKKERFYHDVRVDGLWVNLHIKELTNGEFLYLIGTFSAKELGNLYRKRWCIETFFQSLKTRGFDLKSSHLRNIDKFKKLFALVCIAFTICLTIGRTYLSKVQKIRINKKGYPVKSLFRRGLDWMREYIKGKYQGIFDQLLHKFTRWIDIQLTYNQQLIKIIR